MRQRRYSVVSRRATLWVLASGLLAHQGSAQQSSEALFLLLPVGAQAVGMGQAVVAQRGGSEEVWWNPSAIAGEGVQ